MKHRANLDGNSGLRDWADALEKTVIETVESGVYTKDLALCVSGNSNPPRDSYVNTE